MTDPATPAPEAPATAPASKTLKIALAVSVALNLAVAGLAAGAWMKEGGPHGGPRDFSFGPFSEALSQDDRRALRKALFDRGPDFQASREAARAEFGALLAALRADPFDPAALGTALAAIEKRNADRLELGRSMIETRITEMSVADRLAFADRLEAGLNRKPGGE